jgi:HlyD family secretion protein
MALSDVQRPWQGQGVWIGIITLSLLGGGFLAIRLFGTPPQAEPSAESTASPQQVTVAALGRLEPEGEVVAVGGPRDERIGRLMVSENNLVQPGQVLALLESYPERLAERNYAATQFQEARARFLAVTQAGGAQIQEAQTRLAQIAEPQTFEIQAQAATIRQQEAELQLEQVNLRRSQGLQRDGAISQQELDSQVTEVRQRQEALNSARANLIRLQATRSTDMNNARAQVQSAQANLSQSQVEVEVASAARNLDLAQARLDRTVIRAPSAGEILRIQTQAGEAIGDDGILQMGNTRQMNVVAEVYESDVGLVRLGQQAEITSRNGAFPEILTGRVFRVGGQIFKNNVLDDDPAANADARVVEVRIRLDQPVKQLTNLQVDVKIDVAGNVAAPVAPSPAPTTTP